MEAYGAIDFGVRFGEVPLYKKVRGNALWLVWLGFGLTLAEVYLGSDIKWPDEPYSPFIPGIIGSLNVLAITAGLAVLDSRLTRTVSFCLSFVVSIVAFVYGVCGFLWSLEVLGATTVTWIFLAGIVTRPMGITCLFFLILTTINDK